MPQPVPLARLSGSVGPPLEDMQDHYGMTFGNSTRQAYRKECKRKHQAL